MKLESGKIYAISLARISTQKQHLEGDTTEYQIRQCDLYIQKRGWEHYKSFPYIYSTVKQDKEYLDEIIEFCKDSPVRIKYLVIKSIDRIGRQGAVTYQVMKKQLASVGVELVDTCGVIQPAINTLEHLGVSYSWSTVSPSEKAELSEAKRQKEKLPRFSHG